MLLLAVSFCQAPESRRARQILVQGQSFVVVVVWLSTNEPKVCLVSDENAELFGMFGQLACFHLKVKLF